MTIDETTDETRVERTDAAGDVVGDFAGDAAPVVRTNLARNMAMVIGVVMIVLVALLATRKSADSTRPGNRLVGRIAPEFTGTSIFDGSQVSLSQLRSKNKYVLVNFFGSNCIGCVREHPDLIKIADAHRKDLEVVGVLFQDNVEDARDFFKRNGGSWPVIDNPIIPVDYGVIAMPESFLVSPQGVVLNKTTGSIKASNFDKLFSRVKA